MPPSRARPQETPTDPGGPILAPAQDPTSAQPAGAGIEEVTAFLESLRLALQNKDLDQIAAHYLTFPQRQRLALEAYLGVADNLNIEISDTSVKEQDGNLVVSFTRRDRFDDTKTERPVRLEVRLYKYSCARTEL